MQVRWRGLELPARVEKDSKSATDNFGRFTAEPFVRGMGTTIGNRTGLGHAFRLGPCQSPGQYRNYLPAGDDV